MARPTLNIEAPVLMELRTLQKNEGKSLGQLVSELLTEALGSRRSSVPLKKPTLRWNFKPMRARIDLDDKDALHAMLHPRWQSGEI